MKIRSFEILPQNYLSIVYCLQNVDLTKYEVHEGL